MNWRRVLLPLGLGLGAALCFALDTQLDARERRSRVASQRLGPLVDEATRETLAVAGLRLSHGESSQLYTRTDGVWRCSWRGALVDEAAVAGLVEELLAANGPIDALPPEDFAAYGFGGDDELRVELLGPDLATHPGGDVRLGVALGKSLPSVGGCFARRLDEDAVRTLDVDPTLRLSRDDERPALLDPTLLGQALVPRGVQLTNMLVELRERPTVRLIERPSGATEEQIRRGASPYLHVLVDDEGETQHTVGALVTSFDVFLRTARWDEILAPEELASVGLDRPEGRVLVGRTVGEPLQLILGPQLPDGRCGVLNPTSGLAFLAPPEVAAAFRPRTEDFRPGALVNLWDAWLTVKAGPEPRR